METAPLILHDPQDDLSQANHENSQTTNSPPESPLFPSVLISIFIFILVSPLTYVIGTFNVFTSSCIGFVVSVVSFCFVYLVLHMVHLEKIEQYKTINNEE